MDKLNSRYPNGILNLGSKSQDVLSFLQQKIVVDIPEQTEDMNRIYNFRNYIESLETELEQDSGFKVEYLNASVLGVEAVSFIDVEEYDKYRDKALPTYVVSPLFVYAPDIDRMLYKRNQDETDSERLFNFTVPLRVVGYQETDNEKENNEKEEIKISYLNFETVIMPLIKESMVEDESQAKILERKKALATESDTVKQYVSDARNLDIAMEKLLLKELDYNTKARELEEDIQKYNKTIIKFDEKLKDLEEGIEYLEEKKGKQIELEEELVDIQSKSIGDMPTVLKEVKKEMEKIFNQYRIEYLDNLTAKIVEAKINEGEIDKERFREEVAQILEEFVDKYEYVETEHDDKNGSTALILEYLTMESEMLENDALQSITPFNSKLVIKPIKQLEEGYKYLRGNLHLDNDTFKSILTELSNLNEKTPIKVIKKDNKNRFVVFNADVDGLSNTYFVSPIYVCNATLDKTYAGYNKGETEHATDEYKNRTKDNIQYTITEDNKMLQSIITLVTENYRSREEKIKEFVFKQEIVEDDETWVTKVDSFLAYLKLNLPIYQKLLKENILVSASHNTKIPLTRNKVYSGSYVGFKTPTFTIIISAKSIYYIKNETKTLATVVKYETMSELCTIIKQNKNVFGGNEDRIVQLVTRLLLGLDLRGNYVVHLTKYEKEHGTISLKTIKQ